MPDGPVVALIVLAAGGVLAGVYFLVEHRRHRRQEMRKREVERLPLFGTDLLATRGEDGELHTAEESPAPRPVPRRPSIVARPVQPPTEDGRAAANDTDYGAYRNANGAYGTSNGMGNGYGAPGAPASPDYAPVPSPPRVRPAAGGWSAAGLGGSVAPATAIVGAGPGFAPIASTDPGLVSGETLRFAVPDEGTLRFLPGRLEVSAGPDAGREVRFVAPPGGHAGHAGPIEITFGRTEGPAFRHVQLLARTVSRRHASMCLSDDHWSLKNLSATNPVLLNGRPLAADEVAPLLVDGDRIEMGEVVFTFHSR